MPSLSSSDRALFGCFAAVLTAFSVAVIVLAMSTGKMAALLLVPLIVVIPVGIILIFYLLPIAIHEGGHYLAGKLIGLHFKGVVIGPFSWKVTEGKLRFAFDRNVHHGLMFMEPGDRIISRGSSALYIMGGPLASLITALTGGAIARWGMADDVPVRPVLILFTLANAFSFLSFFTTRSVAGYPSDRVALASLYLAGGAKIKAAAKQIESQSGEPPRNWESGAIRVLSESKGAPVQRAWAYELVFHHHLDAGRFDEAEIYLKRALDQLDDSTALHSQSGVDLLLEGAFYFAGRRGHIARAKNLLGRLPRCPIIFFPTARRALIAIDYCEGRIDQAERRLNRALASATASTAPLATTEADYLRLLREWRREAS